MKKSTFDKFVSKLKAEGYIVIEEPTDVDTIDPDKSIKIYGWYYDFGPGWMPSKSNTHHFNKEEAENLGQKIEELGISSLGVHINGWRDQDKKWRYDMEITREDFKPEIEVVTILWNDGSTTEIHPPYDDKIINAFVREHEEKIAELDYDISREYDEAKAEEKIEELDREE